jgi:uncharacterized protein
MSNFATHTTPHTILLLPGWHGNGPDHWQTHWAQQHPATKVEQSDWMKPLRGDWLIQLEEAVLAATQATNSKVVLVAHSLGCVLVAAWAAHSQNTHRVHAALLVAPADVECAPLLHQLPTWQPIALQPLPFASRVLASQNDEFCSFDRATALAQHWGSNLVDMGRTGHINSQSQLGAWPDGWAHVQELVK